MLPVRQKGGKPACLLFRSSSSPLRFAIALCALLLVHVPVLAQQSESALAVINDFLGADGQKQLRVSVHIDLEPSSAGCDGYAYHYADGLLVVHSSSPVAACRGFYDFVKSNGAGICTWSGNRFSLPQEIKKTSQPCTYSPYRHHQYFNVVTYGYSMPYWDEARWDQELNWMALHGIDMPLMLVGSEQIYRKVFQELYGVTDAQLDSWEVGPAHLPWMRMGNLAGNSFDGPLGSHWHQRQNQLAKHILRRMRQLGMKPIVPAFGGFVPREVAQQTGRFVATGWDWMPEEYKNYRLIPSPDGEFKKIGKRFIELWDVEYESFYGQFQYYLSDSFNEMVVPNDEDTLAEYGSQIYQAIREGSRNDSAVWVTQGWEFVYGSHKWTNGRTPAAKLEALFRNVPLHRVTVLSMSPEYGGYGNKKWELYNNYGGHDWINTMLPNMGGKNFWTGRLQDYAQTFPSALRNSSGSKNCTGWGMTMEGIEYNDMLYELISDMGWSADTSVNLDKWIDAYGRARYGVYTDELRALHQTLLNTVYSGYIDHQNFGWQGNGRSTQYYLPGNINTADSLFAEGFERFFCAENLSLLKGSAPLDAPLRSDLIEFAAFYAASSIQKACAHILAAADSGALGLANSLIAQLDGLLYDMDYALTGHPHFDEHKWESMAVSLAGEDPVTQESYRKNARRIVSTWYGSHRDHEPVNDYASRIYAGLVRDYYRPRLIGELRALVSHADVDLRRIELDFIPNGDSPAPAPPLSTPRRLVSGRLVEGPGIDAGTADADLLDFLKHLVDESHAAAHGMIIED